MTQLNRCAVAVIGAMLNVPLGLAADSSAPLQVRVTGDVVTQGLFPFTATIGSIGSSLINGGSFEPHVWRNKIYASETAPDRVIGSQSAISAHDLLREGFLDGGRVRVYRIEDGAFKLVREDQVAPGGFHASGWHGAVADNKLIPADSPKFEFAFDAYNRPEVPYWFTVRAVDANGNLSEPGGSVRIIRPANAGKGRAENALNDFRVPRNAAAGTVAAPANLQASVNEETGVVTFTWNAVPNVAGYRVYRSDYDPAEHKGYAIVLAGGAPDDASQHIREGDMVLLEKTFTTFSRNAYQSNRVWGSHQNKEAMSRLMPFFPDEDPNQTWELVRHEADTPVSDGGETYLKLTAKDDRKLAIATYNHSGTQQQWYEVLDPTKTYVMEAWLKSESGPAKATFSFTGFYGRTVKVPPQTFDLTEKWQKVTYEFTPPQLNTGRTPEQMRLEFQGPGVFGVDNVRFYRKDAGYLNFVPEDYAAIKESGMSSMRTHGFIKTGRGTYNMDQFTNAAGLINGVSKDNTLPQTLAIMKAAEVDPWLQVEMHMDEAEWAGFVEYMAAPYDPAVDSPQSKPWAHKRYAQGQQKPWIDEFERVYFEISNETWNGLFAPWTFDAMTDAVTGKRYPRGGPYGLWQEHIRAAMAKSPHFARLDGKMKWVIGGWAINNYGVEAMAESPNSEYMMIAAYNGGWDEGEGPATGSDQGLYNVLLQVPHSATFRSINTRRTLEQFREQHGRGYRLGTYEAGPGYALSGLNNQPQMSPEEVESQDRAMKSLAAGTATLDTFLDKAYYGYEIQNFFTFGRSRNHWKSHAQWYQGGAAYPSWLVLEMFNHHGTGDMLRTETTSAPTVSLPKFRRRPAVDAAPMAAVYATRQADRVSVFVVSRKLDKYPEAAEAGFTPVTIELPFTSAQNLTLYRMAGDPRAHNLDGAEVKFERVPLGADAVQQMFVVNAATGADARGLPPASTFIYVFEGVQMPEGKLVTPELPPTP